MDAYLLGQLPPKVVWQKEALGQKKLVQKNCHGVQSDAVHVLSEMQ